jgi:hypothetical protein
MGPFSGFLEHAKTAAVSKFFIETYSMDSKSANEWHISTCRI